MQKIVPNLWFDKNAEEAVKFYLSVFKKGKIINTTHYTEAGHDVHKMEAGTVLTIEFELEGQRFIALNGGPAFKFSPAISFIVTCKDQEEIDYYWEKLSAVPEAEQCGWLQDKFGLSWQVVPEGMDEMLNDPDREKADRAMEAMLKMKKIDIKGLQAAGI